MADLTIYLGNKNYSSWSLRAWLVLKRTTVAFEEVVVPLFQPTSRETVLKYSPSGRLPALKHGELTVWDSLAICEYLAESFPTFDFWPKDPAMRAAARAVSAEMHSGFQAMRQHLPMNIRSSFPGREITPEAQAIWPKLGGAISGSKSVPASAYPDDISKKSAAALSSAKIFRFDGSDAMPVAMSDAFLKSILDFVKDQSKLDSLLTNLDTVQKSAYSG